jgi:peptide/nickel transport system substrate-binding protein
MTAVIRIAVAQPAPIAGGQLTWAIDRESTTIVPINATTFMSEAVGPKIFDGLLTYDADLKPEPQLAESWQVSADGLTCTFKLRPGVRWHDGQPFTSRDVAFSFERMKAAHPRGRITFGKVAAIDTPDDLTVILRLSQPAPYLITALASAESPMVPRHIFEGVDPMGAPPDRAIIGTGPFRFVRWDRGNIVVLERNPDYWNKASPISIGS